MVGVLARPGVVFALMSMWLKITTNIFIKSQKKKEKLKTFWGWGDCKKMLLFHTPWFNLGSFPIAFFVFVFDVDN